MNRIKKRDPSTNTRVPASRKRLQSALILDRQFGAAY